MVIFVIYKNLNMLNYLMKFSMKTKYLVLITLILYIYACKETDRFSINSDDTVPPGKPVLVDQKPLYGGVRLFYKLPSDRDLLSIDAEFTSANGKTVKFSASYFADSLDVYGFGDTLEHTVSLYAVDRAGNKSEYVSVPVTCLEPAISRVAKTLKVAPAFGSFFIDWQNELGQTVNVYVNFTYTDNGVYQDKSIVFSSMDIKERRYINDLNLNESEPVNVKIMVEDLYGNITEPINMGNITLKVDERIPKDKFTMPNTNDSIGGVPMAFLNGGEGKSRYLFDDIIDRGRTVNYTHTTDRGRTGDSKDGNVPWNVLVDLGDYYELSRILTHQRHSADKLTQRGEYFSKGNVAVYSMYIWDDDLETWEYLSTDTIPVPSVTDLEMSIIGEAGHLVSMYPDEPRFTKPTRWFRYEALNTFDANYTGKAAQAISEITLFGKKANR
jgi:hypothetical protein